METSESVEKAFAWFVYKLFEIFKFFISQVINIFSWIYAASKSAQNQNENFHLFVDTAGKFFCASDDDQW